MKHFFAVCVLALMVCSHAGAQNRIDIEITTGSDDLSMRSKQGNITLSVKRRTEFGGGELVGLSNANRGEGWPSGSIRVVSLPLDAGVTLEDIAHCYLSISRENFRVFDRFGQPHRFPSVDVDNWDVRKLMLTAVLVENGVVKTYRLKEAARNPYLFRFRYYTGGSPAVNTLEFDRAPQLVSGGATERARTSTVSNFAVELGTGGDDLGGGGNNATIVITVRAADGSTRTFDLPNINQSRKIDNFQSYTHQVDLPAAQRGIEIPQIVSVGIRHDGGSGIGADNWDLDRFKISFVHNGAEKILVDLAGTPIFRFTGERRFKEFRVEP